jgi:probable HAF family extracellular repeat protein
MIDLMPPGADASEATAINNQGEIVGNAVFTGDAFTTAVAWVSGHVIKLPPLQGYQNGGAVAINERGQIAGYSTTRGAGTRATLWVPESEFAPPTRQR